MAKAKKDPSERRRVGLLFDERMCKHKQPEGNHLENPERIRAIWNNLNASGLLKRCVVLNAKEAEDDQLALVHSKEHIDFIKTISSKNLKEMRKCANKYDSIYFNKGSSEAAYLAAGFVIEATEQVAKGELDSAFAIVRPPGHHAEEAEPMGFCLFNNVAIATSVILNERPELGVKKILIVDWDVHHGNSTQKMFYMDPRVLVFSVHRHDFGTFYPEGNDGSYDMMGEGLGAGYNINVPWENGGVGDADYFAVWDHILIPVAREFDPDMIIISAGFDAAIDDPIGGCFLSPYGYSIMLYKLLEFARGKIVMALEGGYNPVSLAKSTQACIEMLLDGNPPIRSLEDLPLESTWRLIQAVRQALCVYWPILGSKIPDKVINSRSLQIEVDVEMPAVEQMIRKRIGKLLDERFPELMTNEAAKKDVAEILVWRDIRQMEFEDFAIILENKGGVRPFLEYELQIRKLAGVCIANELMYDASVLSLVHRKLGIPESAAQQEVTAQLPELVKERSETPQVEIIISDEEEQTAEQAAGFSQEVEAEKQPDEEMQAADETVVGAAVEAQKVEAQTTDQVEIPNEAEHIEQIPPATSAPLVLQPSVEFEQNLLKSLKATVKAGVRDLREEITFAVSAALESTIRRQREETLVHCQRIIDEGREHSADQMIKITAQMAEVDAQRSASFSKMVEERMTQIQAQLTELHNSLADLKKTTDRIQQGVADFKIASVAAQANLQTALDNLQVSSSSGSASTAQFESLKKDMSTGFGRICTHLSGLLDATKKGEEEKRSEIKNKIEDHETRLQAVEKRLQAMDNFLAKKQIQYARKKQMARGQSSSAAPPDSEEETRISLKRPRELKKRKDRRS